MILTRINIENFRSIKSTTIELEPRCRVLVGINESGKTNIISALSLLGKNSPPNKLVDKREETPHETPIEDSYVRFVFTLDEEEIEEVKQLFLDSILLEFLETEFIKYNKSNKNVSDFISSINSANYKVNILSESKFVTVFWNENTNVVAKGWKKPSSECPADFTITVDEMDYKVEDFGLICPDFKNYIPDQYLVDATSNDVRDLLTECLTVVINRKLPDVLFWEYSPTNLLPNYIEISEFANNPDICPPLRNMFTLHGIIDIKKSLAEAIQYTPNKLKGYLDRIANSTTKHFREVWEDYPEIEFTLHSNTTQIIPGVKEENTHDFSRRSDGFKRFVTFLLMISAQAKTKKLENTLLIIDEPDHGLHISGAKYLKDRLIDISETNYVVYSTHSIFMIDTSRIDRHYIVTKDKEITSIKKAAPENIQDEEVLYNALGYSIFSILKQSNIIFEGWKDKILFNIAVNSNPALLKKWRNVGICHSKGASAIKNITPMIELANRKCVIVSDNDPPSHQEKKSYEEQKGYGRWLTYYDVDNSITAITGEDFIKNNYISNTINSILPDIGINEVFDESTLSDENKIETIKSFINRSVSDKGNRREAILKIKDSIFENLNADNIEPTYFVFLDFLFQKISSA